MRKLEVIAVTPEDAVHAQAGGASSVEIVENLAVGGLTPDLDVVRAIRDSVTIHTRVIVRPHARDFVYKADEIDLMLRQINKLARIGVDGIVFGALKPDSSVDLALTRQIAGAVRPLELTFHRAIDVCRDADQALPALRGIVQRVLTSGQGESVWDGRETIVAWVEQFGAEFTVACGGGLRAEHLPELIRVTNAPEYHVGTAARTDHVVDQVKVAALVKAINA